MGPTITAFAAAPDRGRGLARDMAVRWALEEVGQPHAVLAVPLADLKGAAHLARHPFGQIPTYADEAVSLFESGAIVHHIASRWPGLWPADPAARARAVQWMFAAQATIEPPIVEWSMARLVESGEPWFAARQPLLERRVHDRLGQLAAHLGPRHWLDGDFSAGDLLMVCVLRRLAGSGLLDEQSALAAYVARGEGRPAFARALAAQAALFAATT